MRLANFRRIILFAAAVYLAVTFLDAIATMLILFFLAFLIAVALNPPVRWLASKGVPRGVSVAGAALLIFGGIGAAAYYWGPPLVEQVIEYAHALPQTLARVRERLADQFPVLRDNLQNVDFGPGDLLGQAGSLVQRVGRYTLNLFGLLAMAVFVLIAALYALASPEPLVRGLITAVPPAYRAEATHVMTRIVGQLEAWVLATLLLMTIVGVATGLGLWLLGVPNPVLFGVIAFIGEGIPTLGPILSAIPPIVMTLADDPTKALWVALLFLAVQQLEGNVLVPLVMAQHLKLHPVTVLFAVLTLGAYIGILGAFLAVPIAIIGKTLFEEFYEKRRMPKPEALDEAAEQVIRAYPDRGQGLAS